MILAAAEAARNRKAPPPPELRWMWEALDLGALPDGPDLWSQPAGLVARMRWCYRAYEVTRSFLRARDWRAWQQQNPGDWEIYRWLLELRRAQD